MSQFTNKAIIITGAGQGIGRPYQENSPKKGLKL